MNRKLTNMGTSLRDVPTDARNRKAIIGNLPANMGIKNTALNAVLMTM